MSLLTYITNADALVNQTRNSLLLMALVLVFFLLAGHQWKCSINGNAGLKSQLSDIVGKLMMMAHSIISGRVVILYHRNRLTCCEMILLVAKRWMMMIILPPKQMQ